MTTAYAPSFRNGEDPPSKNLVIPHVGVVLEGVQVLQQQERAAKFQYLMSNPAAAAV